jgi:polysaccharide biosynthesis protein PslJ
MTTTALRSFDSNRRARSVREAVARRKRSIDAVTLLTVYGVILMLIPATLTFAPLGQVGTPEIGVAACLLVWFLAAWISGSITLSRTGRSIRISMVIFSLAILASFVAAMTRGLTQSETLAADSGLIWLATGAGLVFIASQCIDSYERLDKLLRRLVILGSIVSAIGVVQFFGFDLTKFVTIPGLTINAAAVNDVLTRGGFSRPWSTTAQPIELSVVLAMLLPLAVQQALDPARVGRFRKWAPVVLLAVGIPMTVSKSGVLGAAVVLICFLPSWRPARQRRALGVVAVGMGAMHFVSGGLLTTLIQAFTSAVSGQDLGVQDRVADYSGVAQYIAQRPVFGMGFGTFLPQVYRFTDNMYLLGIVEFGIVGVLAMLLVFGSGMQCALRGRRLTRDEPRRELGYALFISMVVVMVTSATFDSLTFTIFSGLFFVLLGCCGAYLGIMSKEAELSAAIDGTARSPGVARSRASGSATAASPSVPPAYQD